ncbi:hypothetical protein AB0K47_17700 [Streptomyces tirandamycinicus]|uniref:hypothetical protein n=1 Tax=Streptomyces tirandamycinicus TaxID=2174846 RepID=UPI00344A42F6
MNTMTLAEDAETSVVPLILSIASLIVAVIAVAISLSQARLAKRESERARPNVAMSAFFTDNLAHAAGSRVRAVGVSIKNTGREDTELASIWIYSERTMLNGTHNRLADKDPTLPHRINGHSETQWIFDGTNIEDDASEVTVVAKLGHGETLSVRASKR